MLNVQYVLRHSSLEYLDIRPIYFKRSKTIQELSHFDLCLAETKVCSSGNMVGFQKRHFCMHTHTLTHILYERQSKARREQMFIYKVAAGRTWQRSLQAGSARVPMNYWYSSCLNVWERGNSPGAHYKHWRQTKSHSLTLTFQLKCGLFLTWGKDSNWIWKINTFPSPPSVTSTLHQTMKVASEINTKQRQQ